MVNKYAAAADHAQRQANKGGRPVKVYRLLGEWGTCEAHKELPKAALHVSTFPPNPNPTETAPC